MMKRSFPIRGIILLACLFVFAACGAMPPGQGGESLFAVVLRTGSQCRPAAEGWRATWITSAEALLEMQARCRSNFIPIESADASHVDFSRFGVLTVEMGRQTTAGYGFAKDGVTARLDGRSVTVCLTCTRPDPGTMTAQVITSPWIWVRLPAGEYENVRVVDPEGRLLVQLP